MSANRWPPAGWEILLEDTDCLYGKDLGNGRIHFIEVTDMPAACGSDWEDPCQFVIELNEVDLAVLSENALEGGRESVGMEEEDWAELSDVWKAETIHSYGRRAHLASDKAKTGYQAAVRRMAKLSDDISENPAVHECYMNAQANRIGQTTREFMQGDMESALKRAGGPPSAHCGPPADATVEEFHPLGRALRRNVRQGDLSNECLSVQIWGLGRCQTCEYRQTPKCGGKEIRRTGETADGLHVPVGVQHG